MSKVSLPRSQWGQRYFPIGSYWRHVFGQKVYKISVSVAETCPVRSGDGSKVCIFCDELGSAAFHLRRDLTLAAQIRENRERIARRFRAKKFLVYFQAYTNTFDRVETLRQRFEVALAQEGIGGFVVGTRPDCLPSRMVSLLEEYASRTYVMLELGSQSFCDEQLRFLRRGHDVAATLRACEKLAPIKNLDVALHLMFGLPGETNGQMVETARTINGLGVRAVKLHNLHVLKDTPLEALYEQDTFQPISLEAYAERVITFLRHLHPDIAIQRLAAHANRHEELVAPEWTRLKMAPTQFIRDQMMAQDIWQGDLAAVDAIPSQ